jgi:hypothetical protein
MTRSLSGGERVIPRNFQMESSTMPKLTLDCESLSVESFPTSDLATGFEAGDLIPLTLKTKPTCCPCTP